MPFNYFSLIYKRIARRNFSVYIVCHPSTHVSPCIELLWVTVPTPSFRILLSIFVFCKVGLLLGCLCTCVLCVDIILCFFSDMLDLSNCILLSLNGRGLKSQLKRRSLFSYLKSQKCLFTLNQKMKHCGEMNGIFYSHGTNHQEGVCILINPAYDLSVTSHFSDPEGRIVIINLIIQKVKLFENGDYSRK